MPFSRNRSTAFSKSPLASVSALRQSKIPAPVAARNSLIISVVISIDLILRFLSQQQRPRARQVQASQQQVVLSLERLHVRHSFWQEWLHRAGHYLPVPHPSPPPSEYGGWIFQAESAPQRQPSLRPLPYAWPYLP